MNTKVEIIDREEIPIVEDEIVIPDFTKADFIETSKPFEWVLQYEHNDFIFQQLLVKMQDVSKDVGVRNFLKLLKSYKAFKMGKNDILKNNFSEFNGQPITLKTGEWICDDLGVRFPNGLLGEVQACNHPIIPIQRLVDIDSGYEKLKIAYKKGDIWRHTIVDKEILASSNKILELSKIGVAVNSENAKYLVRYFTDMEHLNYKELPELNSVTRLGWIEGYGFSPYVKNIAFDGEDNFKSFFKSVSTKGSLEEWVNLCKIARKNSTINKIILATSFASVLVGPCGKLPFFLHLWGGTEAGKTVALMLATSVWANPEMGKYIHSFNSTQVAQELSAGFVNSLPLMLDELQIIKDKQSFDDLLYQLTQGEGKMRGQKTGGLQKTGTWKNAIMTTGEFAITNSNSGGGAVNRVIEIDCKDTKLFKDPIKALEIMRSNYGHAGKKFIEYISNEDTLNSIKSWQKEFQQIISEGDTTDKQAAPASLILLADFLICKLFFHPKDALKPEEISKYLSTRQEVSSNFRCYNFLKDFVAINGDKFGRGDFVNEVWGVEDKDNEDCMFFILSKFNKILSAEGYNAKSFLSWASEQGIIIKDKNGNNSIVRRVYGSLARCVHLNLNHFND